MPDIIGGIKSHMDVQTSDGRGMLLRYVASYVPKFSDSFATEWLNDQANDYGISKRVLTEWCSAHIGHPYPTQGEKEGLAQQTNLSLRQLNDW